LTTLEHQVRLDIYTKTTASDWYSQAIALHPKKDNLIMQLIQAIAQARPRKVTTKYGERTVIDAVRRDNGEKVTIWRGGDDEYSQRHIIPSSPITLTLDSKGKYNLVENPLIAGLGQPTPNNQQPTAKKEDSSLSPTQKREIATYIGDMADLFNFCLKTVDQRVENIDADDRRAIATTLYLSATKQFGI
jgi:hypothetical protein